MIKLYVINILVFYHKIVIDDDVRDLYIKLDTYHVLLINMKF